MNEYFLIENRQLVGRDSDLPGHGLAIWHINTTKTNSFGNRVNADENLKGVDLEEADGNDDLDNEVNRGDRGDLFPGTSNRTTFDDNTTPSAQNYLLGNFNINNVIQISDYTFIQNSLGVNLDWKFSETYESSFSSYNKNSQELLFSLHYKLGFGIKATQRLFIIPTLETPILNVKQWENARSDYGIFSSRYRPVILTVRFAWLIKPNKNACPPVPGGDGKDYDQMMQME